ncbi:hypothetical protein GJAV_G00204260 [Gymnothorax javanicus]|nr:hypothetical protein GJAV_G00204260 [Gymnothorax javanicus]
MAKEAGYLTAASLLPGLLLVERTEGSPGNCVWSCCGFPASLEGRMAVPKCVTTRFHSCHGFSSTVS